MLLYRIIRGLFLHIVALWVVMSYAQAQFGQQGPKLSGTGAVGNANQGISVAISADGNTALVGGPNDSDSIGAVWVWTRASAGVWTQQGPKLIGAGAVAPSYQGTSVAISADGNTAIVGGPVDHGNVGAVWVWIRSGGVWTQQGSKLVGTGGLGVFEAQGASVALSADGNTALIGGPKDFGYSRGAAWAWTRSNGMWTQQQILVASDANPDLGVKQGSSVALSADGNTALVGGPWDHDGTGAMFVWSRSGGVWTQQVPKLVGSGAIGNVLAPIYQGASVAISADGNTAVAGGNGDNNGIGALWVWKNSFGVWTQQGLKLVGAGAVGNAGQGSSVAISADGKTFIEAGSGDNSGAGAAWVFGPGLGFFPLSACRMVDTRAGYGKSGAFGPPSLSAYSSRDFPLESSSCGLPTSAQVYSANFTAIPTGTLDFLSAWPTGQMFPGVSTLNSPDGSIVANAAIVRAGVNGAVTVMSDQPTDLLMDINGYFGMSNGQDLAFYLIPPCRVADTRSNQGKAGAFGPPNLGAFASRDFPITSSACGIPPSAQAFSLNMTAVPRGRLDFVSAWATGAIYPGVSTLNSIDGSIIANAAIVQAGNNGSITVLASNATDFIIDANGYFAAPGSAGALHFYPVLPCRVADTRSDQGKTGAFGPPSLNGNLGHDFPIPSSGCSIPSSAQAYSLNLTAIPQGPLDFLSVWATGQPYPGVSTLNSPKGTVIANAAIVPAGAGGAITVVPDRLTDLIIDIIGYFAP